MTIESADYGPKAVPSGAFGEALQAALDIIAPSLAIDDLRIAARFEREGQPSQPINDLYTICILNTEGLAVEGRLSHQTPLSFALRGRGDAVQLSAEGTLAAEFIETLADQLGLSPLARAEGAP
ncbi:MAG TPA: hypothetical protein VGE07_19195 [Herpetosiphonaceae bacterium]